MLAAVLEQVNVELTSYGLPPFAPPEKKAQTPEEKAAETALLEEWGVELEEDETFTRQSVIAGAAAGRDARRGVPSLIG